MRIRSSALPFVVVTAACVGLALSAPACVTAQQVDEKGFAEAKAKEGAFISGAPLGLGVPEVVNRRDLVYAVAFGKGDVIAFVHHVTTHMELTATQVEPLRPRFQQPVNPTEFDVEDVVILDQGPGKGTIAVPSRQGIARAFDAKSGALVHEVITGTALVRIAASPDGGTLALGATDGRILLLDPGTFAVRGQLKVHDDEVRGLAFLDNDRLASTSFDGTVRVLRVTPSTNATITASTGALKTGERVFIAHLDGKSAISTVRDTRQPSCAISTAAAKRLSLKPVLDSTTGTLPVITSAGPSEAPAVELGRVRIHTLDLGAFTAAVCDACVPPGSELVLGGSALTRASFVDDIAKDEIIVRPTEAEDKATLVDGAVTLVEEKRATLPGPGTDLDVSRNGSVVVSFSAERAERSFEIYDLEKKGLYPPPAPNSAAALFDTATGKLGRSFVGHNGFTTTAAISPDGRTVVTGGWDKRVLVFDAQTGEQVTERELGWLVRRVRFSPDGHLLGAAAWTPVNALNEGNSEPALLLYPVALAQPKIATRR